MVIGGVLICKDGMDYLSKMEEDGVYIIIDAIDPDMPEVVEVFKKKHHADKYLENILKRGEHEHRKLSIHFSLIAE